MDKEKTKLKIATEEIKDILRKHDLAGAVSLHTPGQAFMFVHFNTSYSCAYIYDEGNVRIYSKSSDYASKEEHMDKLAKTLNMFEMLFKTSSALKKAFACYHSALAHTLRSKGSNPKDL